MEEEYTQKTRIQETVDRRQNEDRKDRMMAKPKSKAVSLARSPKLARATENSEKAKEVDTDFRRPTLIGFPFFNPIDPC